MKQSGFYKLSQGYIDSVKSETERKLPQILFDESRHPNIDPKMFNYIRQNILPKYEHFDKAHNREHADRVIRNSLSIANEYDVDISKVYVTAAYHDIGLLQGRENHEKNSADYLLSDSMLKEWFTDEELFLISEAIEDHRASNTHEPRSIYGKIVSEADRDIEYNMILKRVILYSLEHFPNHSAEQHFDRAYSHMQDKYGENGYLKLWLDTEPNRSNLAKIRKALASVDVFKSDFMRMLNETKN